MFKLTDFDSHWHGLILICYTYDSGTSRTEVGPKDLSYSHASVWSCCLRGTLHKMSPLESDMVLRDSVSSVMGLSVPPRCC